jgi:hypothetical protein
LPRALRRQGSAAYVGIERVHGEIDGNGFTIRQRMEVGMIRNVHKRLVAAPISEVGSLLDRLGGPDDVVWPSPAWVPMVLDGPVAVGAAGGHGPIRYRVTAHEPGRRVEFTLDPRLGLHGRHTFTAEPVGPGATLLRHVAEARLSGAMRLAWPLAVRWIHDAVLEDLFDKAERAVGARPHRSARWTPWVRLLRPLGAERAQAVPVPATPLLADALPRVDWTDAYAVRRRPGTPADPQAWAAAAFRTPPVWVALAVGVREALVGLVGIDRGGSSSFDTVRQRAGEVLLGTDERHLDFRASVLVEQDRVVLSTVVQVHNPRGRAYSVLVRRVHPIVVRAMLARAARLVSRSSNPAGAATTRIDA